MGFKKLMILLAALVTSTMLFVACEPDTDGNLENNTATNPESDVSDAARWHIILDSKLSWKMDGATLIIRGSGEMPSFGLDDGTPRPWDEYRDSIEYVIIEDGVTSVGEGAFYNYTSLTEVTIPNSVTLIGNHAFAYTGLIDINIPQSVSAIQDYAFEGCKSLTSISIFSNRLNLGRVPFKDIAPTCTIYGRVNSGLETYARAHGYTFGMISESVVWELDGNTLIISGIGPIGNYGTNYAQTAPWMNEGVKIENVIIKYGVTSIGNSAFEHCKSLKSITIPNSVNSIGDNAFHNCHSLTNITLPNSITAIGYSAFEYCQSLASIVIPNSISVIKEETFGHCMSLRNITLPDSITYIGDSAFQYCTALRSITLPNHLTSIGNRAFEDCKNLTSIVIPNGISVIEEETFANCRALSSVTLPESVTDIEKDAFVNHAKPFTIYGVPGSYAEKYAKQNGNKFIEQ